MEIGCSVPELQSEESDVSISEWRPDAEPYREVPCCIFLVIVIPSRLSQVSAVCIWMIPQFDHDVNNTLPYGKWLKYYLLHYILTGNQINMHITLAYRGGKPTPL